LKKVNFFDIYMLTTGQLNEDSLLKIVNSFYLHSFSEPDTCTDDTHDVFSFCFAALPQLSATFTATVGGT